MELQIFSIIALIFSAVIHEYMHGWMAERLGDNTAKDLGRLTLNPLKHLDPIGSVALPLLLIITGSPFLFGWAKPVPYNPFALRDQKWGSAKVAMAGPLGNLIVALFFGAILRFFPMPSMIIASFFATIVLINLVLMVFNLVPIPPLDGSKIIAAFLPHELAMRYLSAERFGMIFVLLFVMIGFSFITPVIFWLFRIIVGG